MPVLAVCRGSQVLNVARGGDLVQHLPRSSATKPQAHAGVFADHGVEILPGTRLHDVVGEHAPVKSHHQGYGRLGDGLREAARADDGTVEAIEDPARRFALGVLWHPEEDEDSALFTALSTRRSATGKNADDHGPQPGDREPIAELPEPGVEETDAAVARAKAAFPAWRAVAPPTGPACAGWPRSSRSTARSSRASSRRTWASRSPARAARSGWSPRSSTSARRGRQAPRRDDPGRRRRRPHLPRAPRGRRPDRPLELPAQHLELEARPRARVREHGRAKPAELTPLSALRVAELALEAGIPEGVVNVVAGKGSVVGQRMVEHPDVAKIGFTGSTEVGRRVMECAAATIKRVTLELGRKSANVVSADADLEQAAAAALHAVFDNAGQDCCARSRILVERSAYDRFLEVLFEATRGVKVGDPADEATEMGPLISAAHRETVSSFVDGDVAFQGETPSGAGFWFPCTLIEASNDDRVAREEVFGPVAAVIPFADEEEALRLANDTPYASRARSGRGTARGPCAWRAASNPASSRSTRTAPCACRPRSAASSSPASDGELGLHGLEGYSEVKNVHISTTSDRR